MRDIIFNLIICTSHHMGCQIILAGNVTIGYYVAVQEYQHAFGS